MSRAARAVGVAALCALAACNRTSGTLSEQVPKLAEAAASGTVVEMRWEFHPRVDALMAVTPQLSPEAQVAVVEAATAAHLVYAKAIDNSDAKTLSVVGDLQQRTLEWRTDERRLDPARFEALQAVTPAVFAAIQAISADEQLTERTKWQVVTALFQAIVPDLVRSLAPSLAPSLPAPGAPPPPAVK